MADTKKRTLKEKAISKHQKRQKQIQSTSDESLSIGDPQAAYRDENVAAEYNALVADHVIFLEKITVEVVNYKHIRQLIQFTTTHPIAKHDPAFYIPSEAAIFLESIRVLPDPNLEPLCRTAPARAGPSPTKSNGAISKSHQKDTQEVNQSDGERESENQGDPSDVLQQRDLTDPDGFPRVTKQELDRLWPFSTLFPQLRAPVPHRKGNEHQQRSPPSRAPMSEAQYIAELVNIACTYIEKAKG
ncbi:Nn.00g018350.m01.CDS01 [Neocucurbitaria sp. VM-36]